jgi:octaprenyl-diphosphate synthase
LGIAAPFEGNAPKTGGSIEPMLHLVSEDMEAVNKYILDQMASDVEIIPALAAHLIQAGGKRLRPMLTIASAKLCQYPGRGHIDLAAAVEFMHTATLLHDDVVDDSDTRRGKLAARKLWGNQASVLVGDFLLGQAFRMMVKTGSLAALEILSNAAAVIAEGEVMQLAAAKNVETDETEYLSIITAKTAALFAAACEVSAAVAGRSDDERAKLAAYGTNLGIAFQLVDDALDYAGNSQTLGKSVGDDFREGKITLPVILSYRAGSAVQRRFWERTLAEGDVTEADLNTAVGLVQEHAAIATTLARARSYGELAREALRPFPEGPAKAAMAEVVDFCIARAY